MRYLAIDPGTKRFGLALSDAGESMAFPYEIVAAGPELISRIAAVVRSEKIDTVVVGLPLNMDGSEGPRAKASRAFAATLGKNISVPVVLFDERLSSAEADWKLAQTELTRDKKKKRQDAVAAAAFLQAFLDHKKEALVRPAMVISPTAQEASQQAVELFCSLAAEVIARRGICTCAVSGGGSPGLFFQLLARVSGIDWTKLHVFWADDRCVEPNHADSNYHLAMTNWLHRVDIPLQNIHRIEGELPPYQATERYEDSIRRHFSLSEGQWPRWDMVILGLGSDGHTASLLPGTDVLDNQINLAAQVHSEAVPHTRITLTAPAIMSARCLLFLIFGGQKAGTIRDILVPPLRPWQYPVHALWPAVSKMTWFLDAQAAESIKSA